MIMASIVTISLLILRSIGALEVVIGDEIAIQCDTVIEARHKRGLTLWKSNSFPSAEWPHSFVYID